ncbi:MAG: type IV pilus twitching motility protein PilT [Capsulimonadaceae bacterium]|nr:type IV pilus twitching motility protein PilT [Capsulimonadaceae bacterium]
MDLIELLRKTVHDGASDLHLTTGARPSYRMNGHIVPLEYPILDGDSLMRMLDGQMSPDIRRRFEHTHDVDFAIEMPGLARFRTNYFLSRRGAGAVFRVIPSQVPSASALGLPDAVLRLSREENGLLLVTGPTGSGKSTTLAAIIDIINTERRAHILTVEDPIEFVHPHRNCIVNQREVSVHTETFASALRAALREDPDIILVGEMRDLETIALAITAAETGHLVLATLHTSSAPQTVDRIIDAFSPHQQNQIRTQLAESLRGVVAQTLLPKIGGGRVAAQEILIGNTAVRNMIREGKSHQLRSAIEMNAAIGMQTLEQSIRGLWEQGIISRETVTARGINLPPDAKVISASAEDPQTTRPVPVAATPKHTVAPESLSVLPDLEDEDLQDLLPV